MTAGTVVEALRLRYAAPEWVLMTEVQHPRVPRQADVIAVSTWQSRGCAIVGVEVKISRADWLAELRTPEKAEAFASLVDQWWVAAPRGVVQPSEVPPAWGLLELPSTGRAQLRTAKQPVVERLGAARRPEPVSRLWLGRLLQRSVVETVRAAGMERGEVARLRDQLATAMVRLERDRVDHKKHTDGEIRIGQLEAQLAAVERLVGVPTDELVKLSRGVATGFDAEVVARTSARLLTMARSAVKARRALDGVLAALEVPSAHRSTTRPTEAGQHPQEA